MSINLNSRNNTLCCKVNDLYTALMASELLNDCVDYVNIEDKFEHYHNFYAVFEQDAAL